MLDLEKISPFVRRVQLKQDKFLSGQWQDFNHVLTYIASGAAMFVVEGKDYYLQKGDIILMPPYAHHIITNDSQKGTFTQYVIDFDMVKDPKRIELTYRDTWNDPEPKIIPEAERFLNGNVMVASMNNEQQKMMQQLFPIMYSEFFREEFGYQEILKGFLLYFLTQICRNYQKADLEEKPDKKSLSPKSWKHVCLAIDYIGNRFSDPTLSNDDIAEKVGVTSIYLTRVFKKYVGISMHRYLLNYRIEQGKELLAKDGYSVTDIARMTGFSSVQTFSKVFHTNTGLTPREYANAHASHDFVFFRPQIQK